jgi:hypothetical protein
MHIEYTAGCSTGQLMELLLANTDISTGFSPFPDTTKHFRGLISDNSFDITYNSLIKGIRPGVRGTVTDSAGGSVLVADTYLRPSDMLILIIITAVALYYTVSLFTGLDNWNLIPLTFCLAILGAKALIYHQRKRIILQILRDLLHGIAP